ncbi:MAG: hypothetical protein LBQ66_09870 [Planctomycetaceae bacterium]|jgi:hypothetical protein|nr:hypothetical protein [Planctomycetaceae bacterium]
MFKFKFINLFAGLQAISVGVATVLSAIPMIQRVPKYDRETRMKNLLAIHEDTIRRSTLPDSTKENLIVSLYAPNNLEGVTEALAADYKMIGNDMKNAVKQYVNGT